MFCSAAITDIGITKPVNQDCALLVEAKGHGGNILLAAVCDGMGGLNAGEEASAILCGTILKWFEETLPSILFTYNQELLEDVFQSEFLSIIRIADDKIKRQIRGESGTTMALILLYQNRYYIANVGDSRVYIIDETARQLTTDQTVIQDLLDKGLIKPEEVATHPQRNTLLQCVGAGEVVSPQFIFGDYLNDDSFLVCSDGFRHVLSQEEIAALSLTNENTEEALEANIKHTIEKVKNRKEKDNITAIVIKVVGE